MFVSSSDEMLYMEHIVHKSTLSRNIPHLLAVAGVGIVVYSTIDINTLSAIVYHGFALNDVILYSGLGVILAATLCFSATHCYDNEYLDVYKAQLKANSKTKEEFEKNVAAYTKATEATQDSLGCAFTAIAIAGAGGASMGLAYLAVNYGAAHVQPLLSAGPVLNVTNMMGISTQSLNHISISLASYLIIAMAASGILYGCWAASTNTREQDKDKVRGNALVSITQATGIIMVGASVNVMMPEILTAVFGVSPLGQIPTLLLSTAIIIPFFALANNYIYRQVQIRYIDSLFTAQDQSFHPMMSFNEDEFNRLMGASALTMYRDKDTENGLRKDGYNKVYSVFEKNGAHAMVFYNETTKAAIVAFRPTLSQKELLIDATFMPAQPNFGKNMLVHGGMLRVVYNIQPYIEQALKQASGVEDLSQINLTTVGHSLGSGLATLYGISFQDRFYNKDQDKEREKPVNRVKTLATGAPRVVYDNPNVAPDEIKVPNTRVTRFGQKVDPVDKIGFKWAGANEVGHVVEGPQKLNPLDLVHTPGAYQRAGQDVYKHSELSFDRNPISHSAASLLGHLLGNPIPFLNSMVRKAGSPGILNLFGSVKLEGVDKPIDAKDTGGVATGSFTEVPAIQDDAITAPEIIDGQYNTRIGSDSINVQTGLRLVLPHGYVDKIMHHLFGNGGQTR